MKANASNEREGPEMSNARRELEQVAVLCLVWWVEGKPLGHRVPPFLRALLGHNPPQPTHREGTAHRLCWGRIWRQEKGGLSMFWNSSDGADWPTGPGTQLSDPRIKTGGSDQTPK